MDAELAELHRGAVEERRRMVPDPKPSLETPVRCPACNHATWGDTQNADGTYNCPSLGCRVETFRGDDE